MPFDEDNVSKSKRNIGLKEQKPSIFDNKPKKPTPQQFNSSVSEKESKLASASNDIAKATTELVGLFSDKVLVKNKTPFHSSYENDVINNFISVCGKIDENEDGQFINEGSLSGIGLLIKLLLSQKNRINELEYNIQSLINSSKEKDEQK